MSKNHLEYFSLQTCVSMFALLLVAIGILTNVVQLDLRGASSRAASVNTANR
jgi:hypothetical protein